MKTQLGLLLFLMGSVQLTLKAADSTLVFQHFKAILSTEKARNFEHPDELDKVAEYIFNVFDLYGDSTVYQSYTARGNTYRNVITSFGPTDKPRIIVGAHYDVCGYQDGADDNASGVVALLELARMLDPQTLNYRVDLVAYSLEEPPYFRSDYMGSSVHAAYLHRNQIPVYGMVCLDMVGYFSDEKGSQKYPIPLLKIFYGSRGNYISSVRKYHPGKFARKFNRLFKSNNFIKVKTLKAPAKVPGIDFSDHLNYWEYDYSAIFITDGGFYRNPNYHQAGDVLETIDIARFMAVIDALHFSLSGM